MLRVGVREDVARGASDDQRRTGDPRQVVAERREPRRELTKPLRRKVPAVVLPPTSHSGAGEGSAACSGAGGGRARVERARLLDEGVDRVELGRRRHEVPDAVGAGHPDSGPTSTSTSASTRSGSRRVDRGHSPIDCPTNITARARARKTPAMSARAVEPVFEAGDHSLSPCPRWSSARQWYSSRKARQRRSQVCAFSPPPCRNRTARPRYPSRGSASASPQDHLAVLGSAEIAGLQPGDLASQPEVLELIGGCHAHDPRCPPELLARSARAPKHHDLTTHILSLSLSPNMLRR